jgi:putative NADH-flavin reductase
MKVLVFGATGKTGGLVVNRAIAKGHTVSVLVREPEKFSHAAVQVFPGDSTHPSDVRQAVRGQDAVIDTIGGTTPYKSTDLESSSAHNIIQAMQAEGVGRLIVVSMMGIGDSKEQTPFWYEHLLMPTFLHGSTKDKTAMEGEVKSSGLDFVIARPPLLKDDPATGQVKVLSGEETGHTITRADLADFLVDQLGQEAHLGQAVTVVNQ